MKKNISKNNCNYVQMGGTNSYNIDTNHTIFSPDNPVPGSVPRMRTHGVQDRLSDGTVEFLPDKKKEKSRGELIYKTAHGRASRTKDGAVLLYLKVFIDEDLNIPETMEHEAHEAANKIKEKQLKR